MFIATPSYSGEPSEATRRTAEGVFARHGGQWRIVDRVPWVGNARSELVGQFRESNQAHILWIDSDVAFAPEIIDTMLKADAPVITCSYRQRKPPHHFVARVPAGEGRDVNGHLVVQIESDGLGCCLVRRDAIETLYARHGDELGYVNDAGQPRAHLFAHGVAEIDGVRRAEGEDGAFFRRCREAGFKIECLADATIYHDGIPGRLSEVL